MPYAGRLFIATSLVCVACGGPGALPDLAVPRWGVATDVTVLPFRAITLARVGCFGACPAYSATFLRDGTVTYKGSRFVDRMGEHTGRLPLEEFAGLGQFVQRIGFATFEPAYTAHRQDVETVTVTVTHLDGTTTTVLESGRQGPPGLWALQRVLDGLLVHVKWNNNGAG